MTDGQPMPSKGMNPILKWLLIGCGTICLLMILALASCVWFVKKQVVDPARAEMQKQGIDVSHGLTGVAGASMGKAAALTLAQAIPSLPAEEQAKAKQVAETLAEKGSKMSQADIEAFSQAMKRYQEAVEPQRKARHEAMWNEQDPTKKAQLAQEALKVDPKDAHQLLTDLQAIADRIQ